MSYGKNRTERMSFRASEQTVKMLPSLLQYVSVSSISQLTEVAIIMLALGVGKMSLEEVPVTLKPIVENIQNNLLVKNSNENMSTEYLSAQRVGWLDRELREIEKICYTSRDMIMNMLPSIVMMTNEQLAALPDSFKSADSRFNDDKHYFTKCSEENFKEAIRRSQLNKF